MCYSALFASIYCYVLCIRVINYYIIKRAVQQHLLYIIISVGELLVLSTCALGEIISQLRCIASLIRISSASYLQKTVYNPTNEPLTIVYGFYRELPSATLRRFHYRNKYRQIIHLEYNIQFNISFTVTVQVQRPSPP